jgi:subtilisin family serine protease
MKFIAILVTLLVVGTVSASALAPLLGWDDETKIDNEYIVVFKKGISDAEVEQHLEEVKSELPAGDEIFEVWNLNNDFRGYHARFSAEMVGHVLVDLRVQYVDTNKVVKANQACSAQNGATWGLNRVSERKIDLNGLYKYDNSAGQSVDCYIVDTGIETTHPDFGGRAYFGINTAGGTNTDCNGHGTHVAGTVAGTKWGIAKKATLWAVKVLGCDGSGSTSGIVTGLQWVIKNQQSRKRPSVINMSLGGGASKSLDDGVASVVKAGISAAVAAGNENTDACSRSPAREKVAITVAATDIANKATKQEDIRASFSNYGGCVDLFAPGVLIESDWINNGVKTISGTSMATPHVCGVAALILGANPNSSPADVKDAIIQHGTANLIQDARASPNLLLHSSC